ncbi:MAG TPA: hypothetical protein G4O08_09290 [Anaerolineae bacterium]|nr:hypothetical protein [Anaerolineae bacterium]
MNLPKLGNRAALLICSALALSLTSPVPLQLMAWTADALQATAFPAKRVLMVSPATVDLDGDGSLESVELVDGRAIIRREDADLWTSPEDWQVIQGSISDLNHDDQPEVALLLWREFAPWPVDAYMLHPGRIQDFHDAHNRSCHLILIGWRSQTFREIWAGSALSDPITAFSAVDIDGDGRQELIALEGTYDRNKRVARAITVWDWNGFGFTLRWRSLGGRFQTLTAAHIHDGPIFLIVQGLARR